MRVPCSMNHGMARGSRRGLSLVEVVLALAILAGAMVMLGELVRIGSRQAREARDRSKGMTYCQSVMDQIESTIVPVAGASQTPVSVDPQWTYTVVSQPSSVQGLLDVTVIVNRASETNMAQPFEVRLQRRLVDPQLLIPVVEE